MGRFTPDQIAFQELVREISNGGRRPIPVEGAEIIMDWAQELNYTGFRAGIRDVSVPSNWSGNGGQPHIHLYGVGKSGHIPVEPGVRPRTGETD
jgi:hypothetical protein